MIASKITSLADDGTFPGLRGSINEDDEGTPGQKTILINKGECVNFLYDKLNAKLMKTISTGNGRRESYQHDPIKGIQLMGNGPEVLKNIVMVGPDLEIEGGGPAVKPARENQFQTETPLSKCPKLL